ncbi:MAG: aspartate aminotransferase family protein [Sutterellaceae bacterium]|nr:aspartate aminotransferase family protein [Burkholderiaceae bacterium]MDW8431064.1 aspartate aminotransferase family protein [Sutterellaceae bacterium]
MTTYNRLPVAFTHGRGAWLVAEDGTEYLDALAGIAVNGLGHAHPRLIKALAEQAGRLIHVSNIYRIREQEALAERLCALSGMEAVFFANSGSEANEAALKLVRLYGHQRGQPQAQTLVMERAWHGRTLATLAATGSEKARRGFEPLPTGFIRVPYNDIEAIERVAAHDPRVLAVWLEVLQGEGGIRVADREYVRALRRLCDERGWLLMIDEVQSGVGRTGKWFGYQWSEVQPDVITLAKGLGSGVPIGAILARGPAARVFTPGSHGSTFGGGPFACRAALETLAIIEEEGLLANAARQGERIRAGLARALASVPGVVAIRGEGLMIGVELDRPCGELVTMALQARLLINVTQDNVVRLLPPLVIDDNEADEIVARLAPCIARFADAARCAA